MLTAAAKREEQDFSAETNAWLLYKVTSKLKN